MTANTTPYVSRAEIERMLTNAEPVTGVTAGVIIRHGSIELLLMSGDLYAVTLTAKNLAVGFNRPVTFRFNDRVVVIAPDSDPVDVVAKHLAPLS